MLGSVLTDAIVVIVVLGGMIFVHELGHFMAAKAFGVRVLVFSLGFGKRLLHYTWHGTDYRVSALPLGGYVKMAGDDPTEVRQGERGEFLSQPRSHRFVIVIMGPAMNALLAVVLLAGLYKFHYQKPAYEEQPARVGDVDANSPAARAGLLPGDRILRLANLVNPKWEDVEIKILTSVGEPLPVQLERHGEALQTTLTPHAEGPNQVGGVGWYPYVPGVVDKVEPGYPAAKAGLQAGDAIAKLDGKEVLFWPQFSTALQAGQGKPVELTIRRAGKEFNVTLKPTLSDSMGEKHWLIGVDFRREVLVKKLPLLSALSASVQENVRYALVTFDVLGKILTRRMSTRSLSGPIGIAQLSGEAYRAGFPELLMLVAFISLQLGIFNVLPIPVLDGGVILLLLIETVIRRDLSLEVKERFAQVGIVFLLLLAVFVMYNDIVKTFRPY